MIKTFQVPPLRAAESCVSILAGKALNLDYWASSLCKNINIHFNRATGSTIDMSAEDVEEIRLSAQKVEDLLNSIVQEVNLFRNTLAGLHELSS